MAESAVTAKRNVLLTVDTTTASVQALQYAVHEIYRPGDVLHLLHVAPVLSPQYTIGHGKSLVGGAINAHMVSNCSSETYTGTDMLRACTSLPSRRTCRKQNTRLEVGAWAMLHISIAWLLSAVAPQTTFDVPDPAGELDTERLQGSIKEYLRTQ